jgi:hypothetical protein
LHLPSYLGSNGHKVVLKQDLRHQINIIFSIGLLSTTAAIPTFLEKSCTCVYLTLGPVSSGKSKGGYSEIARKMNVIKVFSVLK